MEDAITDTNAHEINRLWSEVNSLQKETSILDGASEKNCNKAIDIFSKLLDLVDKEKDPHDYCVALRMRAQNYSQLNKFDEALKDLHEERDFNSKNLDDLRVKECEELITKISVLNNLHRNSIDDVR